jgi:hypothetical protein
LSDFRIYRTLLVIAWIGDAEHLFCGLYDRTNLRYGTSMHVTVLVKNNITDGPKVYIPELVT